MPPSRALVLPGIREREASHDADKPAPTTLASPVTKQQRVPPVENAAPRTQHHRTQEASGRAHLPSERARGGVG